MKFLKKVDGIRIYTNEGDKDKGHSMANAIVEMVQKGMTTRPPCRRHSLSS